MNEYTIHSAKMVPLDRSNVDTDQIIPKQFLKSIKKTGFGPNLFDSWRYLDSGYPGQSPGIQPAVARKGIPADRLGILQISTLIYFQCCAMHKNQLRINTF